MKPEEARDAVEAALRSGLAAHGGLAAKVAQLAVEARDEDEFTNLALIYMAELSDWTIELAHYIGDHKWESAMMALPSANQAVQKLAGAVAKLAMPPPKS